jgi:hypothetical protein
VCCAGYGDDNKQFTVISFGKDPNRKFPTAYFRKAITFSKTSGRRYTASVPCGLRVVRTQRDCDSNALCDVRVTASSARRACSSTTASSCT